MPFLTILKALNFDFGQFLQGKYSNVTSQNQFRNFTLELLSPDQNSDAHFSDFEFLVEKREKWSISRREKTEKSRKIVPKYQ